MHPGRRLQRRRTELGLTQAGLAERAGVSRALISAVESGRHLPRVDAALALAAALGTTADGLFGRPAAAAEDALTGEPPAPGEAVRVGFVGERAVTTAPRLGDDGWEIADAVAGTGGVGGGLDLGAAARGGPSVVVAGCEPALVLLERILREHGTRAVAIAGSTAAALAALGADRLHAAAVHFPAGAAPAGGRLPPVRVHLARWRVGLAAPRGSRRGWWRSALSGRTEVVQREPGAVAQAAFERAAGRRKAPIAGPRVGSHLAASRCAVALGLPAVTIEPAAAALGAAFHPLETHEVELWVSAERIAEPGVEHLLELLGSAVYRRTLLSVGGYDLAESGRRVA